MAAPHLRRRLPALALLGTALLSCSGAERIPSSVTEELDGNLAIYTSADIDVAVQIERLTASVDDGPAIPIRRDGHPISFGLGEGPHTIEVVGAIRRRASIGGDHIMAPPGQGRFISPVTSGMTSSQLYWQSRRVVVTSRHGCAVFVRVEVLDLRTPDEWSAEPPILELPSQVRCSDERDRAASLPTVTQLPVQQIAPSRDTADAGGDDASGDANASSESPSSSAPDASIASPAP